MSSMKLFLCMIPLVSILSAQATGQKGAALPSTPIPSEASGPTTLEEELLVIKATPYKSTLNRDPFSAPSDAEATQQGDRIDDIAVKGRIVSNGKILAVVSDSRGNVRWLPVGYRFRDGVLTQITDKAVVFQQREIGITSGVSKTVVKPFKLEGGK